MGGRQERWYRFDHQQAISISVAHEGGLQHQQVVRVAVVPTAVGLLEAGHRALAAGAIAHCAVTEWRLTLHLHFQIFVACVVSVVSANVVVYSHLMLMFLLPFQHVGQQADISGNITQGFDVNCRHAQGVQVRDPNRPTKPLPVFLTLQFLKRGGRQPE